MFSAPVNRIIPFSSVDGPGNRMAIFLQSCPFQCWYCHNPETINMCVHCGICVTSCPSDALHLIDGKVVWNSSACTQCDTCIKICPYHSSPKITWYNVTEMMTKIAEVKPFIRGITLSGGECMNYPEFMQGIFTQTKKMGLNCLIDSNGYRLFSEYPELMKVCDGVMLDVKAVNPEFHLQLTHHTNENVLRNLDDLLLMGKLEEVRIVVLPGYDAHNRETIIYVAEHVKSHVKIKLLTYRPYGVRKEGLEKLGISMPSEKAMESYRQLALESGASDVIIL